MRCAICAENLRHATVYFHFWHVTAEMPFSFIIILFVILSHPIKIYNQSFTFSHSFFASPSALSHTLFFSHCSYMLHTAIFLSPILPSTSSLSSLIYKNQVHRFFFSLFPKFFLALFSLFYDLIYRIGSSSQSCRFAVQSEPPPIYSLPSHKFHHQLTIKSPSPVIFPPFFPFFFRSLPSILWSHTPNRFSSSPLCSFGFVLVLFLSMSLVQLFFVCCLALLKAIYYYILLLSLFWFWNSSWFVSLWYPYDLYFWDCCFVVVYLLWCNFVRLSVQSVLWWFICYGVIVADYTNKIQKPKSSHKKIKKLTKGIQHKFWQFISTWFSFKVRFKFFFFFGTWQVLSFYFYFY